MVIAASNDASVSPARAESILRRIPHAELVTSGSDTCFVRFGDDYADVRDGTDGLDFLGCDFRARKSGRLWEQRRIVRAEHR
ncbi:MAG: hypothetical protein ACRDU4_23095 [Mycobacterium sp.]